MVLTLRTCQRPTDIELQDRFWLQVTRELPWCWKPTVSPRLYAKGTQFDPRSWCFAFEESRLVGYLSFTAQREFASLGYPWVLPGFNERVKVTEPRCFSERVQCPKVTPSRQ
jgi:hypothetical protein